MSQHDDIVRLKHMRDAAGEAIVFIESRTREELESDRMLALSLSMLIGIIGEAASRVSAELRDTIPLPWPDIIGMRHRVIHGYDRINLSILWNTVTKDFPPLVAALEGPITESGMSSKAPSLVPGFINSNTQKNLRRTDPPLEGNLPFQVTYVLECLQCSHLYGANGCDVWLRKCPKCQGGQPGLAIN